MNEYKLVVDIAVELPASADVELFRELILTDVLKTVDRFGGLAGGSFTVKLVAAGDGEEFEYGTPS